MSDDETYIPVIPELITNVNDIPDIDRLTPTLYFKDYSIYLYISSISRWNRISGNVMRDLIKEYI